MSLKTYFLIVLAGLILLTLAFFTGRWTKADPPKPQPQFITEYLPGDTVYLPNTTSTAINYKEKPAQLMKDTIATAYFDSIYVDAAGNEIVSCNDVEYNLKQNKFKISEIIEVKGFEKIIRDTIKVTETVVETVEVEADQPFYDTFVFGAISTAAVFLLTILGLNL